MVARRSSSPSSPAIASRTRSAPARSSSQVGRSADEHGHDVVRPEVDPDLSTRPLLDFDAGYVKRSVDAMPRQGDAAPWLMSMSFREDEKVLRGGDVVDDHLRFSRVDHPVAVA